MRPGDQTRTQHLKRRRASSGTIRDTAAMALIELRPGDEIDQYRIMRPLGRGGMGEVYLARDTKLGRRVALKRVRPGSLENEAAYRQFMFEARATATFSHPNIVTIYGVGEHGGTPYVALEYLEGDTLKQRLRQRKLHLQEVLRIGLAIARALGEAHANGILHRDLKPANIMLPPDGRTRVVDFGLASQVGPGGEPVSGAPATGSHSTVGGGTPSYMAPEQWAEDGESAPSTDLWALGVLLFEMLTQQRPFVADDIDALSRLVVLGDADAPRIDAFGEFPAALSNLVARCLTRDPDRRPAATEVAEVLDQLLHPARRLTAEEEGPFRGLLPFQEDHAALFFGREEEVASLRERLRAQPILPIVGPSGAGKSSLVLAGLVPRLREAGRLLVLRLRPGATPFFNLAQRLLSAHEPSQPRHSYSNLHEGLVHGATALASRLRAHPGELAVQLQSLATATDSRVLLVIDQLEELVVMVDEADRRRAFIDALCAAADDVEDPIRVLLTLRHDFLHRVTTSPRARDVFSHVAVVQRPADEILLRTLEEPLSAMGYRFDDADLARDMVAAVAGEPACLPLLQFAAKSLWLQRDRHNKCLTRAAYRSIGGVEGALVTHADGVLEALDDAGLRVARELLMRLVTPERTRRVIRRDQALDGLGAEADIVLTRLVDARLIHAVKARTPDGVTERRVELTHESLVTAWSTLSRWLDESREELAFFREAHEAAELWERRGRRQEELWEGDALDDALRRLQRSTAAVPTSVTRFLEQGRRRAEKHRWRLRAGVGAALGLLALVAAVLLLQKRQADQLRERAIQARDQAKESQAIALQESARAAYARHLILESRAKLRVALETADGPLARGLWWKLQHERLHWRRMVGGAIYSVSFSPDGRALAVGSQDKVAYVFDLETGIAQELHGHGDQVLDVVFSPNGQRLASIGYDGHAMVWKRGESRPTHSWPATGGPGTRSLTWVNDNELVTGSSVTGMLHHWRLEERPRQLAKVEIGTGLLAIAFHPNHGLAIAQDHRVERLSWPDMKRGAAVDAGATVSGIAWLPDGRLVVGTGRGAALFQGDSRKPLAGIEGRVRAVGVSASGQRIAAGDGRGRLWQWNSETLAVEQVFVGGHHAPVVGVAFSPGGALVASSGSEGNLNLWHTERPPAAQDGHQGMVTTVAISPDGRSVYSGGIDQAVRIWDVETGAQRAAFEENADAVRTVAIKHDAEGRAQLMSAHQAGLVKVRELASMRTVAVLRGPHLAALAEADFDPVKRRIAVVSERRGVEVLDYTGQRLPMAASDIKAPRTVVFSPDGKTLALGGRGIALFDVSSGRIVAQSTTGQRHIRSLRFEADDETLVSVDNLGQVTRFHLGKAEPETIYHHADRLLGLAVSPMGSIAVTGARGDVNLVSPAGELLVSASGHSAEANTVAFDREGSRAATGADDGTVRLWRVGGLQPLWRAPLLLGPEALFTHRGWISPTTRHPIAAPTSAWAKAAEHSLLARARGDLICIIGHDGNLSLWSRAQDRVLSQTEHASVTQVEALEGACAGLHHDDVLLLSPGEDARVIARDAVAMGPGAEGDLLVATAAEVRRYDPSGRKSDALAEARGVSALAGLPEGVALGYRNGSVVVRHGSGHVALDGVASSSARRIRPGPSGTVVVGFSDGTVGLWDHQRGHRMGHAKLHGPVEHIAQHGNQLAVATALGQHLVWDLSVFTADYCALLREVWREIPVTWRDGHAIRMPPPAGHRCH